MSDCDGSSRFGRRKCIKAISGGAIISITGCLGENSDSSDGNGEGTNETRGNGEDPNETSGNDGDSNESGAENFPSEDIRMIVPHSAGGGTDRVTRKVAELAGEHMDGSFFVNNVTGGGGAVGMQEGANADADGHTITATTVEISIYEHLGRASLSPDDFTPIIQTSGEPASIAVHQDSEYTTVSSFIEYAENNPGELTISNSGTGAIWHLSAAGMAKEAGIEVNHVPYDGGEPAVQAAVSGEASAVCASAAEIATQVEDGPLEAVGIMSEEPVDHLPNTPTFQEEGVDFTITAWQGLSAPADTPDTIIDTLYDGFSSVYESDEFQSFMEQNGFRMVDRGPEEFSQFMQDEFDKFGEFVPELNIDE